ncbi:MAG: hypothetical protein U0132_18110 [Gemmatimonadaceae bacterium]
MNDHARLDELLEQRGLAMREFTIGEEAAADVLGPCPLLVLRSPEDRVRRLG